MKKIFIVFMLFLCVKVNASIVVMDADSGRVLYSENMNEKKLIASTTKIMTSIIAFENGKLDDKYIVGKEVNLVNGSMLYIKEGEEYTLNDLLHGLMLKSGNDAAMVIANNVFNYEEFIAQMNIKAFKLGMRNTSFLNPHGLNDDTSNYSSAYDLALLMKYAIKNKDFLRITRAKKYGVGLYLWNNKNELLFSYKYLISGKIGYTKKSGPVYVSAAYKDGKTLIVVSINESDKFNLHRRLYETYFKLYDRVNILDKNTFSYLISHKNNHYYIDNDFHMLLKEDEIKKVKVKTFLNDFYNYSEVYFDGKLIHREKVNVLEYSKRNNKIKEFLIFSR